MRPFQLTSYYLNEDSGGGGDPGTLAGDVTGAVAANTVEKVRGIPWTAGTPASNSIPIFTGAAWGFTPIPFLNLIYSNPGPLATAAGATNTDASTRLTPMHLRFNAPTNAGTSNYGVFFTADASGAFNFIVNAAGAVLGPPAGTIEAIYFALMHTSGAPTAACTTVMGTALVSTVSGVPQVRIFGTTGAGLPLGPYFGSFSVTYRF